MSPPDPFKEWPTFMVEVFVAMALGALACLFAYAAMCVAVMFWKTALFLAVSFCVGIILLEEIRR